MSDWSVVVWVRQGCAAIYPLMNVLSSGIVHRVDVLGKWMIASASRDISTPHTHLPPTASTTPRSSTTPSNTP
ncbi:hypothetical protein FIBSPDRAFT_855791 [Athelia psychrophila]|uniref:Uncharacterized protein n=1 Tax=Athelia psychrophila TaxID=1759441 RepID=A0A166P105_9AGAM|nr:hypothetical protein FIBSPDRAFT_855791 [Fibularhizoctonia sp. CBS 109695]